MYRLKTLLFAFLLGAFALLLPAQVFAAPYGEGPYGAGEYGVGEVEDTDPGEDTDSGSGNSGSSGSSDSNPDNSCRNQKPSAAPDLFQINPQANAVKLFFAPVPDHRDRYYVSYGTEPGAQQHGFEFENNENGVIAVDVAALAANTTYYFKVRAGNGCMPGDWGNELAVSTGQRYPSYRWSSLPRIVTTGVARQLNPGSITNVQVHNEEPSDSGAEQPAATARPSVRPSTPEPAPAETSPSFFGKIGNFIKGLFR